MVNCIKPANKNNPECRAVLRNKCISRPASSMSPTQIRGCINMLIYNPPKNLKTQDPEVLSIVVLKSKRKHFDFLVGRTRWDTMGDWKNPVTGKSFPTERNVQLDIQFNDRKDEIVGKRITELFKAYNNKVVKEELLYTRTVPVEETSL